jgi:hypothetical protein
VVVATYESEGSTSDRTATNFAEPIDDGWETRVRLGQDVRLVLACVGGGAIRVGREIARHHIRHLETVAINCDPKVQKFDEFDHRVYLGPDSGVEGDTGGSPFVGGLLARAAEPALERIFRGATFVILVGSLGGGAGSGAFPYVLDVASRYSEVVSAFVIKPFRCEGERRALADRAIGRLHLVEAFVDKRERGFATLQTLDNEQLVGPFGQTAFTRIASHWASLLENHIERAFLAPTEAILEATQYMPTTFRATPVPNSLTVEVPHPAGAPSHPELPPILPAASLSGREVELTFEVVNEARPVAPP